MSDKEGVQWQCYVNSWIRKCSYPEPFKAPLRAVVGCGCPKGESTDSCQACDLPQEQLSVLFDKYCSPTLTWIRKSTKIQAQFSGGTGQNLHETRKLSGALRGSGAHLQPLQSSGRPAALAQPGGRNQQRLELFKLQAETGMRGRPWKLGLSSASSSRQGAVWQKSFPR